MKFAFQRGLKVLAFKRAVEEYSFFGEGLLNFLEQTPSGAADPKPKSETLRHH
jgi:hypothetical protein